jgi:hypothetical protein
MAHVEIRVVHGDVMETPTDLLVLKFAQAWYGVDLQVSQRLGISSGPSVGQYGLAASDGQVAAPAVLLLGVPPLNLFSYKEIRDFGRRAVAVAAQAVPEAASIAVVLHGPNHGLDETECFNAELAGIVEAISANDCSDNLRIVTFVEVNEERARRMKGILAQVAPAGHIPRGGGAGQAGADVGAAVRLNSVGYDSAGKGHVFVAMPYSPEFEDVFAFGIAPAAHASNLLAERMDQVVFAGDIVRHMQGRIAGARIVVADVTGANPNVYLEVGFAWGSGVPTILVCRDVSDLAFDVRGHRCLSYANVVDLHRKLSAEIAALMS